MNFAWLLFILATSQLCGAYKILVVFIGPSKSHYILGAGITNHLLEAGHEVTFVTPFPRKDPPPRLHQIDLSNILHADISGSINNITAVLNNELSMNPITMFKLIYDLAITAIESPNFVKLLADTSQQFDVVINEWMFNDLNAGLSPVFDCPYIWVSTFDSHWMILQLIDERTNPAYVPDAFSGKVPPFTFLGRVEQLLFMTMGLTTMPFVNIYEKSQYERLFGPYIEKRGRSIPPYDEVKYNASLILGNSHVSYGFAHKLPQNYIPIGGYHIDAQVKPLPEDLKQLLDNAKNGVIYFSLGSFCKAKDMPTVLKEGFLKLLSKLKQTVIWKFEEILPDVPKNVHIVNWAPQQSILAHPNCILFITHGGMLSTTETIHFGKPIIGIPIIGDQFTNIDRAVQKGYALRVDLSFDMFDELEKAIEEILKNPKYAESAKQISLVYHDRPVTPGAELVHWVEHVVRTRGALHLRSPALNMPFYQKLYLDLAALVLVIIFILKITIGRLCCPKKQVNKKKKHD